MEKVLKVHSVDVMYDVSFVKVRGEGRQLVLDFATHEGRIVLSLPANEWEAVNRAIKASEFSLDMLGTERWMPVVFEMGGHDRDKYSTD